MPKLGEFAAGYFKLRPRATAAPYIRVVGTTSSFITSRPPIYIATMSQQHEMYYDYPSNRSPGSNRGYNSHTLNRQSSRQFDTYGQLQGLYTAEDHARYDTGRFDRMPAAATLHSNYGYDSNTWNYPGANGAATLGGTGRMKTSIRRAGIPHVCSLSGGRRDADAT